MPSLPSVDVTLFVHNGAATVAEAIDSVLAQTWPNLTLTLIDDGSTDATPDILAAYAARDGRIRRKTNRRNGGAIGGFQRAFWFGDADFVMPKSADDLIAPDFIARAMDVLLAHPGTAMCHARGLVFRDGAAERPAYPAEHALHAVGEDPIARARQVMQHYTSSPSSWGVYRRTAVDQLSPIRFRAGWDHVVLAELALYGEIRHVPEPLYFRRDGGKPVLQLARASTEQGMRGVPLDDVLGELRWRTPLVTTAYAHLEAFAATRLDAAARATLMRLAGAVFRARWLPALRQEAAALRAQLPALTARLATLDPTLAHWLARGLADAVRGVETILPDEDFTAAQLEIAALAGDAQRRAAA
ncbi:MAG: glycosyltransferase family 2 protein [Rhodospirillales bacterium]|nr:glycosyltransferase family 2 protein [Rhodospirillales bacterium]